MVTCCIMGVVQEDQHVLYRCKLKTECPLRTEFWQSGSFCRRAGGMWWSVKQAYDHQPRGQDRGGRLLVGGVPACLVRSGHAGDGHWRG